MQHGYFVITDQGARLAPLVLARVDQAHVYYGILRNRECDTELQHGERPRYNVKYGLVQGQIQALM